MLKQNSKLKNIYFKFYIWVKWGFFVLTSYHLLLFQRWICLTYIFKYTLFSFLADLKLSFGKKSKFYMIGELVLLSDNLRQKSRLIGHSETWQLHEVSLIQHDCQIYAPSKQNKLIYQLVIAWYFLLYLKYTLGIHTLHLYPNFFTPILKSLTLINPKPTFHLNYTYIATTWHYSTLNYH